MGQDLIDLLVADHRVIEGLFAEIETVPDPARRRAALDRVVAELARHAAAEESYLYPALRASLSAGDVLAAYELREHAEAEELLERLTRLDDTDPGFRDLLETLTSEVRHHVQEEETELFPRLREACDAERLAEMGAELLASR